MQKDASGTTRRTISSSSVRLVAVHEVLFASEAKGGMEVARWNNGFDIEIDINNMASRHLHRMKNWKSLP